MSNYTELWQRSLTLLEKYYTQTTINTWFGDADLADLEERGVIITTPENFKKDVIENHYMDKLKEIWADIFSTEMEVKIMTEEEYKLYFKQKDKSYYGLGLSEYTFKNFVVGPANQFAHAAAVAVAERPAEAYNPLFIYGPSGVGKTHLLYAIAHEVKINHPSWQIVYKTSEIFINEMVAAISRNKMMDFRQYRSADLLLIDDVQFLSGKESLQEEFFHTFNAVIAAQHQIVLTSDRPPREIPKLEDRIRSRFESGLTADINAPNFETRCAIILKKADFYGIELPAEVVNFVAEKITSNIRQLEGIVKKMMALNNFMGLPFNIETAKKAIEDVYKENPGINPTPQYIIGAVSNFYGVSAADIVGSRRGKDIMLARQVAIYLTRQLTKYSFPEIGTAFGNRDHTTIMHAIKMMEKRMGEDENMTGSLQIITKIIKGE